jgi:hypothetical protein
MIKPIHALKIFLLTVAFSACLLSVNGAIARDFGECTGDVMKFCQGVQPGQGDISRCLTLNRQSLSRWL